MEGTFFKEMPKFESPEEELNYLRAHMKMREGQLVGMGHIEHAQENAARDVIGEYKDIPAEQMLHPDNIIGQKETEGIVLKLKPEQHDDVMEELLGIVLTKGIRNALSIVKTMSNPHIDDDFHRVLIQYLKTGQALLDFKEDSSTYKALHMTLFEITLPPPENEADKSKNFKEFIGAMEQFYAGMQSIGEGRYNEKENYFTLEVALSNQNDEVVVYAAIPNKHIALFEKQILAFYHNAKIRVIASAQTKIRAEAVLREIESSFNQFSETASNSFVFEQASGSELKKLFHDFSYRTFSPDRILPMNLKELSSVFHFPVGIGSQPQLKEAKAGIAPAPIEMGTEGIVLGINSYRGRDTEIHLAREDRMRHFYTIGQTGTGKTNIMLNMITQDIRNGDGCCYIDPHGTDIQTILSRIPKERIDDVIYFDPAYTARPMGLNMLEYDPKYPEQKTFVVNEMMGIFNKLFDMKVGGGAMFEQYFRNSAFLVMEDPESGSTLLEITRVLGDKTFRDMKLAKCKNPIIKQFWTSAEQTTGDQSLANFVPYISSKFDNFISNDIMRPVVLQQNSVFNFRKIMDEKKILLVNLSKGRLGDINANLIGLVLVGKIQMAALSRVDMFGKPMNDFYLYIDEFQNVTTDSIASILSEARKYRLSLTVAHQYISQLEESIKNAVFGNVGSMAIYRISPEDAAFIEPKFKPTFTANDITKLDNFNSYVNMLVGGVPVKPFSMTSHWSLIEKGNMEVVDALKELSYMKYG